MGLVDSRRRCRLQGAVWAIAMFAMVWGLPARAQPALSLGEAVSLAAARSRLIAAADAQTQAAAEMAVTADRLPDPVLRLGINNLPIDGPERYSLNRDFMTMRSVAVMQEFTRGDKRQARAALAQRELEATRTERRALVADLQRDAALAWFDRSFQESMRELLTAHVAQAELQVQAAETLYRSGRAPQADVLAARAAVLQLQDALADTDRQIAVATAKLGRWLGDEALRPLDTRRVLALPAWAGEDLKVHLQAHPMVVTASRQEALAESEAALARAARSADWSVELMFSQRGPAFSNMVSINLSVPLQWDQAKRQDRELAARLAGIDRARARREDVLRVQEAEVFSLRQEWASHEDRLRRYDELLLPLAAQRGEAALTAYRSGSGALDAVLQARRGEIDVRIERLRIDMDRARIWAQLNYLLPSHDGAQDKSEVTR
jgi:outer membrane protein TolC